MKNERAWSDMAIPPGATLAEELVAREMTQTELAKKMGRPLQAVSEIVRGIKSITAETALQLEDALGISAVFWINLEGNYQLTKARLHRSRLRPAKAASA